MARSVLPGVVLVSGGRMLFLSTNNVSASVLFAATESFAATSCAVLTSSVICAARESRSRTSKEKTTLLSGLSVSIACGSESSPMSITSAGRVRVMRIESA